MEENQMYSGKRSRRRDRSSQKDDVSSSEDDHDVGKHSRGGKKRHRHQKRRTKDASKHKNSESFSSSRRFRHSKKAKKKKRSSRRSTSSSESSTTSSSDSSSGTSSSTSDEESSGQQKKVIVNKRLLAKLAARGETLEERRARRAQRRAARIQATLGYTPEDNPFNDPNLHETFTWKKRELKLKKNKKTNEDDLEESNKNAFEEIEKVRKRRKERELQFEELERIRAEEARMKELENYDEWVRKEEEFHLQQQKQRSAIRLVEGREKPIDVLAKNIILFGMSEQEKDSRSAIKYRDKYNALEAMEDLEAELEEPHLLLKVLKLNELEELLLEIGAFQKLEREASSFVMPDKFEKDNVVLRYWDNLRIVAEDEIKILKSGGANGKHLAMVDDIRKIFDGDLSVVDLEKMKDEIDAKLRQHAAETTAVAGEFDRSYWLFVKEQLMVHIAKLELSELHSKMLVKQLERLEKKKQELAELPSAADTLEGGDKNLGSNSEEARTSGMEVNPEFGDLEEELGLTSEYDLHNDSAIQNYSWQDKYRPRKPRYFNRVKTGYDWNKYNQTHYDKDNPPPKTVQGYKFNIFYPDLIDPTKTPQFQLEPANSDEFCIIRFTAGPPYEDIAFKIVNREWNRSRKRGFKCTFERGVLSLYFNFTTHWYRK